MSYDYSLTQEFPVADQCPNPFGCAKILPTAESLARHWKSVEVGVADQGSKFFQTVINETFGIAFLVKLARRHLHQCRRNDCWHVTVVDMANNRDSLLSKAIRSAEAAHKRGKNDWPLDLCVKERVWTKKVWEELGKLLGSVVQDWRSEGLAWLDRSNPDLAWQMDESFSRVTIDETRAPFYDIALTNYLELVKLGRLENHAWPPLEIACPENSQVSMNEENRITAEREREQREREQREREQKEREQKEREQKRRESEKKRRESEKKEQETRDRERQAREGKARKERTSSGPDMVKVHGKPVLMRNNSFPGHEQYKNKKSSELAKLNRTGNSMNDLLLGRNDTSRQMEGVKGDHKYSEPENAGRSKVNEKRKADWEPRRIDGHRGSHFSDSAPHHGVKPRIEAAKSEKKDGKRAVSNGGWATSTHSKDSIRETEGHNGSAEPKRPLLKRGRWDTGPSEAPVSIEKVLSDKNIERKNEAAVEKTGEKTEKKQENSPKMPPLKRGRWDSDAMGLASNEGGDGRRMVKRKVESIERDSNQSSIIKIETEREENMKPGGVTVLDDVFKSLMADVDDENDSTDEEERLEEEARLKREAEEKERKRKEEEARLKREAEEKERKRKEEEARLKREAEEKERIRKEEEARLKREAEENERIRKEEEARLKREAEEKERKRKEEEARLKREAEEKERIRKEEEARLKREAEEKERERERKRKEEEARLKREAEENERIRKEEEARLKREAEEKERERKEEEARLKREAEEKEREKERKRKEEEDTEIQEESLVHRMAYEEQKSRKEEERMRADVDAKKAIVRAERISAEKAAKRHVLGSQEHVELEEDNESIHTRSSNVESENDPVDEDDDLNELDIDLDSDANEDENDGLSERMRSYYGEVFKTPLTPIAKGPGDDCGGIRAHQIFFQMYCLAEDAGQCGLLEDLDARRICRHIRERVVTKKQDQDELLGLHGRLAGKNADNRELLFELKSLIEKLSAKK